MSQQQEIMEGYLEDAQGRLVPVDKVKPVDMARHELVLEIAQKAKALQNAMRDEKCDMMADVAAFVSLSADEYGVKVGGNKGNIQLISYDGKYKVVRSMAENIGFSEQLQAAQELIGQCLRDWSRDSNDNLCAIVEQAFKVNEEGNVSASKILGLRRLNITDERWLEAMRAIGDSIQIQSTKPYIRIYERDANGKYIPISLDMAAL